MNMIISSGILPEEISFVTSQELEDRLSRADAEGAGI